MQKPSRHNRLACCAKLPGKGMKTAHYSQGYASSRGADNHNWHVGINGAVGGLMQLNVSRTESWDIARPSRIQLTSNPPVATAV